MTLTNIFTYLAETPSAKERLTRDLQARFGKGANPPHVTWDESRTMPYADAVFNETLRMAPPVGNDFRIAQEADVMPSGLKIVPGARLWIPNVSIGRDPHLWSEPDTFKPERWIAHDEATGAELPVKRVDEYVHPRLLLWEETVSWKGHGALREHRLHGEAPRPHRHPAFAQPVPRGSRQVRHDARHLLQGRDEGQDYRGQGGSEQ